MSDHKAVVRWRESMLFDSVSDGRVNINVPLASSVLGEEVAEQGLAPMGLLLVALAGCTIMDVASILQKKRQDVTLLEVEVEGVQADEHPRVYTHINILYRVGGNNIDPAAVERAIELSREKYCPVQAMLKAVATIEDRYELVSSPDQG